MNLMQRWAKRLEDGTWAEALADKLAREPRFTITRDWAEVPYLMRWVLLGQSGRSNDGSKLGVYLHRFLRSDQDEMHDHPWPFVSVILSGWYYEVTPARGWANGSGPRQTRWYGPGRILSRPANWIHQVVIPDGREAWTLVFRGPKERSWGFHCPLVGFVPWRQHLATAQKTGAGCPAGGDS